MASATVTVRAGHVTNLFLSHTDEHSCKGGSGMSVPLRAVALQTHKGSLSSSCAVQPVAAHRNGCNNYRYHLDHRY